MKGGRGEVILLHHGKIRNYFLGSEDHRKNKHEHLCFKGVSLLNSFKRTLQLSSLKKSSSIHLRVNKFLCASARTVL